MNRVPILVLLLAAAQALAVPAKLTISARSFHRYTIVREMEYRGMDCEESTKPEPVMTANPVLEEMNEPVLVNFIVGEDGRTYEPIILSGDGPRNDSEVLRVVKTWRFRPATCNGVPSNTEGSAGFETF